MSRNKNIDYTQYITELKHDLGIGYSAVPILEVGFMCPKTKQRCHMDNCPLTCKVTLSDLGGYLTRKQALRRARYLFGGK